MLGRNNAGWPYPVDRFAPKLTSNNITPQNADTKVPELAAALLEQRTYNQAISDLRLGEEAAAAEQRADFAPLQQAVEQLGVVTGLAAVAPEALADSYAKAIKDAVDKGGDIGAAIENVKRDLVTKIKSGEIEYNKVDGVLEKISKISGAPDITTGDGAFKLDAASGKIIDVASGAPVADVRKLSTGYRVTVPGAEPISIPIAEFDKVFNSTGTWGNLKPETKSKINSIYAAINPATPPPVEYDPLERIEKAYKRELPPSKRKILIENEIIESIYDQPFDYDAMDVKVEHIDPTTVKLEIPNEDGTALTEFSARLDRATKKIGIFDNKGTQITELPVTAFGAWLDAADVYNSTAFTGKMDLRDRVVYSELKKKSRKGGRTDYIAEIKKVYDAAGMPFEDSYTGQEIMRAAAGKFLTGEGKKAARSFGAETKDISRKLFNEVSRQLDKLEAAGKITGKQRAQMIKKTAARLGIKLQ